MKTISQVILLVAVALAGCTQSRTAANQPRPDYFKNRVTYTDSHIPQPLNRVTESPISANTPSQSVARNHPSLYPTDPVVGANAGPADSGDTGPNRNVGAGPAGSAPLPGTN